MKEIPQELITEIFQLLPVKTLLRFRCLSKSLCCIIHSPDFIKLHLRRTSDNRTHRKIIIRDATRFNQSISASIHVLDIDDNYIPFPPPKTPRKLYFRNSDFAHCNGLVLFRGDYDPFNLTLWNPSTNKTRKLSILPTDPLTDELVSHVSSWGIGYDSLVDDYKILLVRIQCYGNYNAEYEYEIWISGLRSLFWRKIENVPRDLNLEKVDNKILVMDNSFRFLGGYDVCAIDVAEETFSRVSHPFDFDDADEYPSSHLQIVEGYLGVPYFSRHEERLDLYVRKKNNDRGEFYWTKLLCVTRQQLSSVKLGSEISYLGFPNVVCGDGIFVLHDKYVLCSYDFIDRRMKRIVIGDKDRQNATFCIESLVPVDYPTER